MINVSHYKCLDELRAASAFLMWQSKDDIVRTEHLDKVLLLKETDGRPSIKIEIGTTVLYSYKQLIKYWDENGLWLI